MWKIQANLTRNLIDLNPFFNPLKMIIFWPATSLTPTWLTRPELDSTHPFCHVYAKRPQQVSNLEMCNLSTFSLSLVGLLNLGLLNWRFIRKFAPMTSIFGVTIMKKCLSSFWAKNALPLFSWFWMNLLKFQLIEPLESKLM